ncbi:MAG: ABC transporter permease [Thermoguttaceae bacterium]
MNPLTHHSIFWRLMWKEYRVQRAFWTSLAVLAVLLMLLACASVSYRDERVRWQFGIALVLPALFSLGCGAMLFAAEREGGTYDFQRSLPIRPAQLLLGKGVFALLSTLVMYVIVWLAAALLGSLTGFTLGDALGNLWAWAIQGRLPGPGSHYAPGAVSVFFALELFLWATLFSLLLRRPLTAAIAGVAAAAVAVEIMTWAVHSPDYFARYATILPLRVMVAAVLALVDAGLCLGWLGEQGATPVRRGLTEDSAEQRSLPFGTNTGARVVARLIWENWRQSRGLLLALAALIVPLAVAYVKCVLHLRAGGAYPEALLPPQIDGLIAVLLALASFPLIGAITFHGDQRGHSYQFLADRGVQPRLVWLGRQAPAWLAIALFVVVLSAIAVMFAALPDIMHTIRDVADLGLVVEVSIVVILFMAMLGFASGQFFSMLFRNGFLAAFFSLVLTGVLALWSGLMWLWGVNWIWSILPIPLALLLATWLRTPHWLLDRNTLRTWAPVGLALAVPAALLFTAVTLFRAYEIPLVDPGFSPEQYARPATAAEQGTLDLYLQAQKQFVPLETFYPKNSERNWDRTRPLPPEEIAWIDANQRAIAATLEASRRKECGYFGDSLREGYDLRELAHLMVVSAVRLEEQGNLEAALERYMAAIRIAVQLRHATTINWEPDHIEQETYELLPYWAARPKQTPERILAAARKINELTANLPADTDAVKLEYVGLRAALRGGYPARIGGYSSRVTSGEFASLTWFWSRLPWERTRALRLLNVLTRRQLDALDNVELAAGRGDAIAQPRVYWYSYSSPSFQAERPYALQEAIRVPDIAEVDWQSELDDRIRRYTAMVTVRRGVRLSLLLEAWKLRHGALPKTLAELVGADLDHVPIDPYTGTPFRYVRDGLKICLLRCQCHFFSLHTIPANAPFVWSAGDRVIYRAPEELVPGGWQKGPDDANYLINDNPWSENRFLRTPHSEYDVWEAGWPFPIATPP